MSSLTSASDDPATPLVRLSRPAELAAATPYLLGFHPVESLIAVTVRRPRGRLGMLVRTDLPKPGQEAGRAATIARYLHSDGADAALVIVHTDEPDIPTTAPVAGRARRDLVDELRSALDGFDIPLYEALLVRGGRWVSYLCHDRACCPAEGNPVDATVESLALASVVSGQVVLGSRADLVRALDPAGGSDAAAVGSAIDRALNRLSRQRNGHGARSPVRPRDVVGAELNARQARWEAPDPPAGTDAASLTPARAAALAVGLVDARIRDAALVRCVSPQAVAFEPLWLELVRRVPPPLDAAPATLLAVSAYSRGNGPFARVCLERALSSHPGYALAELILAALEQAVPPRVLAGAIRTEQARVRGP